MDNKNGKINIVDLFVVAVVMILALGAYVKFGKFNAKSDESMQTEMVYTINIYGVRDYSAEAYRNGDTVYDALTGVNIGFIENVEEKNAEAYEISEDGKLVKVVNPYRRDLTLSIRTSGTVEDSAYYANKSIELKVNSQKAIETKYAKSTGTISSINVK